MTTTHPTLGALRKAFVDEAAACGIPIKHGQSENPEAYVASPNQNETMQQDVDPAEYMGHPYYQKDATQYPSRPQKRTAPGSQELYEPDCPKLLQTSPKIMKIVHEHAEQANPNPKQLEHSSNPYTSKEKYLKVANGRYGYEIDTVLNIFRVGHGTMNTRDHSMQVNFQLQSSDKQNPTQAGFEFPPSYDWDNPVSVTKYLTIALGRYQYALDTILNIFVDGYGFMRLQDGDSNINFELECTNAQCACSDCFP